MAIAVIAGLGNPGPRYVRTRHNIGFMLLDSLAEKHSLSWREESRYKGWTTTWEHGGRKVLLLKPSTFMNDSGHALGEVQRYLKTPPDQFLAVIDEIQLPVGKLKVSQGGSDGGHNGTASIIRRMGASFWRLRLGVGPKPPHFSMTDFVLGRFSDEENTVVTESLPRFRDALELLVEKEPPLAMNHLNQRTTSS